jgi:hypothetical protein
MLGSDAPIVTPSCSCVHRRRRKRTDRTATPPARAGSFLAAYQTFLQEFIGRKNVNRANDPNRPSRSLARTMELAPHKRSHRT